MEFESSELFITKFESSELFCNRIREFRTVYNGIFP